LKIPKYLRQIINKIRAGGYNVFIVGGALRDFLLDSTPEDWDLVTDAGTPQLKRMFEKVVLLGEAHGTVTVIIDDFECEVTRLRGKNIHEDLEYRDFTINAMALDPETQEWFDPFNGKEDLEKGIVRFVLNPGERIKEDPLRLIRAVRFACQLDFEIHEESIEAIKEFSHKITQPATERIRDELSKILLTSRVEKGIDLLKDLGLLEFIIPELLDCVDLPQRGAHIYDVYRHNLKTCSYTPRDLILRLAGLLHDVGKPFVKGDSETPNSYPGHEKAGAELARKILRRLKYSSKTVKHVVSLIQNHLFVSRDNTSDYIVRKLLANLGKEGTEQLLLLMEADRKAISPNFPLENVIRTKKHFKKIIQRDGIITRKDLAIDGRDVIEMLGIEPGPAVGRIIDELWEMVLKDPELNTREKLICILKNKRRD
jgi:putative nucleotidyltransferase with HDIG domain